MSTARGKYAACETSSPAMARAACGIGTLAERHANVERLLRDQDKQIRYLRDLIDDMREMNQTAMRELNREERR